MTQSNQDRALCFLGLCMRAGQIISGQDACVAAVRNGAAALALLDGTASENTRKKMTDTCHSHQVPLYQLDSLGHAIGKPGRLVIALPAGGMAQKLLSLLENQPQL
ncbi:MAG: ribosomal L7Ae/L30e/S12e/Gadd45 family protein [Eubacteriales bacterium]|nr:ribosomal L7Ae/L30e/S12e/Gadd45 family protein [Eubacteriales bacterium]